MLPGVLKVKANHKTREIRITLEKVREKLDFTGYKTS